MRMEPVRKAKAKANMTIPLSISTKATWLITLVIILILLLVDTGFCSGVSSQSQIEQILKLSSLTPTASSKGITIHAINSKNEGTGQTGPSGIDSSGAANTDSETSESQSEPSAFDLLADWANNNEPLDASNPVVSSIASLLSGLGGGSQQNDEESHDENPHDHVQSNDLETGETISHIFHGPGPHHLKKGHHEVVVEEHRPWSFWDWLHSDGTYVAIVLIIFGVIPILIGLLPYFLIASNFWFIFHKIHTLHAAFLDLLHNPLDGYDSHHVGYDYGGSEGWTPEGWRQYRG